MRTPTDALRSLKKYVALALGDEWEVRLTSEEGAFRRPFCRVEPAGDALSRPQGALQRIYAQPFAAVCYPIETITPDEAVLEAERVRDLLEVAFTVGIHAASFRDRYGVGDVIVQRGHPMRVPLYDYDGVALDAAVDETARQPNDFMRVTDSPTVNVVADPAEPMLQTVVLNVRLDWTRSSAITRPGQAVETITVGPDPAP